MASPLVDLPAQRPAKSGFVLRFLLWSGAVFFFVWAVTDPRFRDTEGLLEGLACFPLALGLASLLLGWTTPGRMRAFGAWFALALVGQAAALQMIDAGAYVHYQHYRLTGELFTGPFPFLLAFLALQTIGVGLGLRTHAAAIRDWLTRSFRWWQLAGVALIFFLPSATVSPHIPTYIIELFFAAFVQTVNLGTVLLLVWAVPPEVRTGIKQRYEQMLGAEAETAPLGLDRFAWLAALGVVAVAALLALFVYQRHPHVPDELIYLVHARFLAAGALTMPLPAVPEAFELYLLYIRENVWFAVTPPGWPLMLAAGVRVGLAWLVNPVLAGVNILLSYLLLQGLYGRRIARVAVLLLCVSPWYMFLSMSFMPHLFSLTCALTAMLGVLWARRTGQARWTWLGGFALGVMAAIRPLEAFTMAVLVGLWAIGIGGTRLKLTAIAGLVLGAMAIGALILPYNTLLTGDATIFPIMQYADELFHPNANALGFGPDRGMGWGSDPNPGHSPFDAIVNANLNTFALNVELFGWSIGSLLLVGFMLFSRGLQRSDYLMIALVLGIFTALFFYYFGGGPDFGARYWFLMVIPLVALTARGMAFLEQKMREIPQASSGGVVEIAVLSLCVLSLMTFVPWRAIDKYYHYRNMRPEIRTLAETHNFGRSLVLIRGVHQPDYTSAAIYNPLDFEDDAPLFAWERTPDVREAVITAYSDRPVWVVEGPTRTRRGYRILAGPLPPGTPLPQELETP